MSDAVDGRGAARCRNTIVHPGHPGLRHVAESAPRARGQRSRESGQFSTESSRSNYKYTRPCRADAKGGYGTVRKDVSRVPAPTLSKTATFSILSDLTKGGYGTVRKH
eukprot:3873192-Prymnesium_polylepis.1